jgi:hypothetical protein
MADLLKEAIADAKAVRETAIANAKLALEEAFTPKLQSMLSARINEQGELEDEEDEDENGEEMFEQGEMPMGMMPPMDGAEEEEEDEDEDSDLELESIIRELEGDEDEDEEDEMALEQANSTNIGSGDNKMNQADGNDTKDPEGTGSGVGTAALTGSDLLEQYDDEDEDEDDESLEEVLRALREEDGEEEEEENGEEEAVMETRYVAHAYENKLREAYGAISFLRSKINEVNLLNAKLLFSNKLFRAGSLNESQKLRVIDTFDRARSLREVKLVYSTLAESFKPVRSGAKLLSRKPITEGYPTGYASRPSGTTRPRQVITEGQIQASRFQKLAGLLA